MYHKILVAINHSDIDRPVFNAAVDLAKALNAQMLMLHVLSPLDESSPAAMSVGAEIIYPGLHAEAIKRYMQSWETLEAEGLEYLKSLQTQAIAAGVNVEFQQILGEAGRVICQMARNWRADLILMGRRGHSGLSELFLGSVSNYVLHRAACSVLVVQHPSEAAQNAKGETTAATSAEPDKLSAA
jgi:nucleotide-binding universal stress UspA family protein